MAARPPSLDVLTQDIPPKLDQLCRDEHLSEIALSITGWRTIAPFLGLSRAEEELIACEYPQPRMVAKQNIAMLMKWKEKYGVNATYRELVKAFWKLGNARLVEVIRSMCTMASGPNCPELLEEVAAKLLLLEGGLKSNSERLTNLEYTPVQGQCPTSATMSINWHDLQSCIGRVVNAISSYTNSCSHLAKSCGESEWVSTVKAALEKKEKDVALLAMLDFLEDVNMIVREMCSCLDSVSQKVCKSRQVIPQLRSQYSPIINKQVDKELDRLEDDLKRQKEVVDSILSILAKCLDSYSGTAAISSRSQVEKIASSCRRLGIGGEC